jgi:YD repeat-containing protein
MASVDCGIRSVLPVLFLDFSLGDSENRMTLQQVGSARTTYAYDGDGLRRRMVTSGGTTTYVWDGTDYLQERT